MYELVKSAVFVLIVEITSISLISIPCDLQIMQHIKHFISIINKPSLLYEDMWKHAKRGSTPTEKIIKAQEIFFLCGQIDRRTFIQPSWKQWRY